MSALTTSMSGTCRKKTRWRFGGKGGIGSQSQWKWSFEAGVGGLCSPCPIVNCNMLEENKVAVWRNGRYREAVSVEVDIWEGQYDVLYCIVCISGFQHDKIF